MRRRRERIPGQIKICIQRGASTIPAGIARGRRWGRGGGEARRKKKQDVPRRGVVPRSFAFTFIVAVTKSRFQLSATSDTNRDANRDTNRHLTTTLSRWTRLPLAGFLLRVSRYGEVKVPGARYREKANGN